MEAHLGAGDFILVYQNLLFLKIHLLKNSRPFSKTFPTIIYLIGRSFNWATGIVKD